VSSTSVFEFTATERQEMIRDIVEAEIETRIEALKRTHDDGYLFFGPTTPADQLAKVMQETLPSEFLMLLDPDYIEKAQAGMYPPPLPEVWLLMDQMGQPILRPHDLPGFALKVFASQQEAVMYGQMIGLITPEMLPPVDELGNPLVDDMGMPLPAMMPPPVVPQGSRWSRLLTLTSYKGKGPFQWEQQDLIRLWNTWGRRQEQAVGVLM
jgi:hypothetical protein